MRASIRSPCMEAAAVSKKGKKIIREEEDAGKMTQRSDPVFSVHGGPKKVGRAGGCNRNIVWTSSAQNGVGGRFREKDDAMSSLLRQDEKKQKTEAGRNDGLA